MPAATAPAQPITSGHGVRWGRAGRRRASGPAETAAGRAIGRGVAPGGGPGTTGRRCTPDPAGRGAAAFVTGAGVGTVDFAAIGLTASGGGTALTGTASGTAGRGGAGCWASQVRRTSCTAADRKSVV